MTSSPVQSDSGPVVPANQDDGTVPVIAIDGPTASGKGTVAQRVAQALGFGYLDSGALYRLAALQAVRCGIRLDDVSALAALARGLEVGFADGCAMLGGEDVTTEIRAESVGNAASAIAVHPELRAALVERQRAWRRAPGLVADGRDMGTVIFPDATLKVFLTASAEARARRRHKQLIEKGFAARLDTLLQDLTARDARDSARAAAPLVAAPDAVLIDTSDMDIDAVERAILAAAASRGIGIADL